MGEVDWKVGGGEWKVGVGEWTWVVMGGRLVGVKD